MIVSIGMLAWNEEAGIDRAIQSLFQQSAFSAMADQLPVAEWELIVVPNGCTDATARVATETLARCLAQLPVANNLAAKVVELAEAGKSNAWNCYIHELSRKDTSHFVMVDSDIEFGHPDTIFNCIRLLLEKPGCLVAVDKPLKDFARKNRRTWIEDLSLRFSDRTFEGDAGIAGSFYCARAETLRSVWMPRGLSGEDGFLRAMIVTDFFRSEVDPSRVARAGNASHYYEGLNRLSTIFRHELRMVIGTTLNTYLAWDFLRFATDPQGPGAGVLIRNCVERDPEWYGKYIQNEIQNRGWWKLPRGMLFRRFANFRKLSFPNNLATLPLALLAFVFDLPVFWIANRHLKKADAVGFW